MARMIKGIQGTLSFALVSILYPLPASQAAQHLRFAVRFDPLLLEDRWRSSPFFQHKGRFVTAFDGVTFQRIVAGI
ncbi:MAG: hypothetical protein JTT11_08580, partial [Candidatus Brockarchaeota archaeon]|nr:hypothetical protein [Candidatus Brockarchaeota archaeon]